MTFLWKLTMSNNVKLMDLPDEILLQILGFTDNKTLDTVGLVNRRLEAIAQDQTLNKLRPHHIIKGRLHLNEEVYANPELLREVFQAGTVDLPWLVGRTSALIKESGLTPISWYFLQNAVLIVAVDVGRDAARRASRSVAWSAAWDVAWDAAWECCNSG